MAPDEFLSKSKWVRFQVYLAGPVMNVLLAVVVLTFVLAGGADVPLYESAPAVIGTVAPGSPALMAGLEVGDRVVSVDGVDVPTWNDLSAAVAPKAHRELSIVAIRNGTTVDVHVTPTALGRYEMGDLGIGPMERPEVIQVGPKTPAARAGFQRGDVIVAVNGERGLLDDTIVDRIRKSANVPVVFTVERKGTDVDLTATPQGSPGAGLIGVSISPSRPADRSDVPAGDEAQRPGELGQRGADRQDARWSFHPADTGPPAHGPGGDCRTVGRRGGDWLVGALQSDGR